MKDKWLAILVIGVWLSVGIGTLGLAFCNLPVDSIMTGIKYLSYGGGVVSGLAVFTRIV